MFGLRNLGFFEKGIIERLIFCWGILWLEASSFIERFGDRVIFTLFERISLHLVLGLYYSDCKNCIEIPVREKSSSIPERSRRETLDFIDSIKLVQMICTKILKFFWRYPPSLNSKIDKPIHLEWVLFVSAPQD